MGIIRIKKIIIIGTGNVSWHLSNAFFDVGLDVVQIFGRDINAAKALAKPVQAEAISDFNQLDVHADLVLICVSDSSIKTIVESLPKFTGIVAHTSGAAPLSVLNSCHQFGVFYPLQTFTKGVKVDFSHLPILVEGSSENNYDLLLQLAEMLTTATFKISTNEREKLHVAAVFVNNFTNHLFAQAYDFCKKNNVPFETLQALILETARKATLGNPADNQTGPAVRQDENTINKHLHQLTDANQKHLYQILTNSILKKNETEL